MVLWLRRSMEETVRRQIEAAKAPAVAGEAQPGTMKLLFTQHWKPLLICIGVTLGGTVAFYTYTNFILKFMNDTSGIAKTDTSVINFWALLIFMLLQPVYGLISDKVGRKPLLLWFGITGATLRLHPPPATRPLLARAESRGLPRPRRQRTPPRKAPRTPRAARRL